MSLKTNYRQHTKAMKILTAKADSEGLVKVYKLVALDYDRSKLSAIYATGDYTPGWQKAKRVRIGGVRQRYASPTPRSSYNAYYSGMFHCYIRRRESIFNKTEVIIPVYIQLKDIVAASETRVAATHMLIKPQTYTKAVNALKRMKL